VSRQLWRAIAALTVLSVAATACGNSGSDTATTTTTKGDGSSTTAAGGDRDKFVSISGVPGVTDKEIAYAVIGTKSNNPLGTCIFDCYLQGIKAYFAYRNAEGGIFGRQLVVGQELDDELGQNQVRALEVTSGNKAFGAFEATLLPSGWGDLDAAGVPTYTWGIHATEAANRQNIFPSIAVRCADCTGRAVPYAAKTAGAKHAASIGYGVSENSKVCTNTVADSIKLYSSDTGADLAYVNDNLDFGLSNGIGPEVTAMKKAGVDFIATCIDLNGMKTLAQELERQGMQNVVLYHPNTYNQAFVKEAGGIFDGDFVSVQFLPFESDTKGTALGAFLKWMGKQGSQPSELAMVGWVNATLAFDGLLAAGPSFDRAKVAAATNAMSGFTADGLIEPITWAEAHTPYTQATRSVDKGKECAALVRVEKGAFVTVGPKDRPWLCWSQADTAWAEPVATSFG
jgi:ABC-type branched-subunit amino acid transport system substrate-binding protein